MSLTDDHWRDTLNEYLAKGYTPSAAAEIAEELSDDTGTSEDREPSFGIRRTDQRD